MMKYEFPWLYTPGLQLWQNMMKKNMEKQAKDEYCYIWVGGWGGGELGVRWRVAIDLLLLIIYFYLFEGHESWTGPQYIMVACLHQKNFPYIFLMNRQT